MDALQGKLMVQKSVAPSWRVLVDWLVFQTDDRQVLMLDAKMDNALV